MARKWFPRTLDVLVALIGIGLVLVSGQVAFAAGETRILDIQVTGQDGSPTVYIKTSERPNTSVYSLSDPLQVVVDIANAVPDNAQLGAKARSPIREVAIQEFRNREGVVSRVAIVLDQVADFTSETVDDGIIVRLKLQPGAALASTGSQGLDPLGEQLAMMESGEAMVEQVVIATPTPNTGGSEPAGGKPEPKTEAVPAKPASTSGTRAQSQPTRSSTVPRASAEVVGLDFLPYPDRSRVRIQTSKKVAYSTDTAAGDQIVLTLNSVRVPKAFQRPLDTRDFPSAVQMVSAYTASGRQGARVVVKLVEDVPWEVTQDADFIYVDFEVPPHLARAAAQYEQQAAVSTGSAGNAQGGAQPMPASGGLAAPSSGPANSGMSGTLITGSGQTSEYGSAAAKSGSELGLFGTQAVYSDPEGEARFSGTRFSIDLRNADIHNVFRLISAVSGVNIVTSDDVKGSVTMRLVDVPWDQALMVVLQSKSLGAVRFGNIVRIAPVATLAKERQDTLNAKELSEDLEPTNILVLPLNYASVTEVADQVKSVLSDRGELTSDTRTNSLIIEDTAEHLARAQAMLAKLDTQTPEVLIEARIVEANTSFLREFGIQWGGNLDASANTGSPTGLYFPSSIQAGGGQAQAAQATQVFPSSIDSPNWVIDMPTTNSGMAVNLALGSLSNIVSLDARLTAIETMGKGRVISSPRITTVDNTEARIVDGARIPYATVSAGGTQVQFIDASLELTVLPHITADGRVFMQISVSNNRPDFGSAVDGQPTIQVKEATTEVMIPDGDTTVIGGVYSYETSENKVMIPFLGRIPLIGWMFRSSLVREDRQELLVFITPHILGEKRGDVEPTSF